MKNPKKGATKRIAYGGVALIFVLGMAALAASSFNTGNPEPAQVTKGITDSRDGSGDRTEPCTPLGGTKCGKIVIRKDAGPDSYQDFYFIHNIPGYGSPFVLDDDGTLPNPSTITYVRTFYTPENGNFSVSEQLSPQVWNPQTNQYEGGYNVSISCIDAFGGTTTTQATANISIYQGGTVTCTFKNTPMAPTQVCSAPNTWTQRADIPTTRRKDGVGFNIGNMGYMSTGYNNYDPNPPNYGYFKDLWEYNPVTNMWTQKADFGGMARALAVGFSIGNKGYVGTGYRTNPTQSFNDFWEYDQATNTWEQRASLSVNRENAVGFSIGNKGYIATGWVAGSGTQDIWEYDPATDTWIEKTPFPGSARYKAVAFVLDGKGYIGTGGTDGGSPPYDFNNDLWEYNPTTDSWVQKQSMPPAAYRRKDAVAFAVNNKGYVGTGHGHENGGVHYFQDLWEYTPAQGFMGGSWNQKANYIELVYRSFSFAVSGRGYIGGGYDLGYNNQYNAIDDFWCYKP